MSDYKNAPTWTLINRWTILENRQLQDRPYMRTCVPQRIYINIHDVVIHFGARWRGEEGSLFDAPVNPKHYPALSIEAVGLLNKARIHVFSMKTGIIDTYDEIRQIFILPIEAGRVGGKNNATSLDGIGYSGMSSREVPDGGLMAGEPGSLMWADDQEDRNVPRSQRGVGLILNLYLEHGAFSRLASQALSAGDRIARGEICVIAELFEDEVQASFKENWMSSDYGFLAKSNVESFRYRARLDGISLGTTPVAPMPLLNKDEYGDDGGGDTSPALETNSISSEKEIRSESFSNPMMTLPALTIGMFMGVLISLFFSEAEVSS